MALPTKLTLEIVTPDRALVTEQVDEVVAARRRGLLRRPAGPHAAAGDAEGRRAVVPHRPGEALPRRRVRLRRGAARPGDRARADRRARAGHRRRARRAREAARRGAARASRSPQVESTSNAPAIALMKSLIRLQVASRAHPGLTRSTDAGTAAFDSARPAPDCSHNLRQLFRYRALIPGLVARELKARYRGSVARLLLVVRQPAPAAADLHLRLHGGDAGRASAGARAVRALHVLRHPAVDLVLLVAARVVQRARSPAAT